jgi:hypothetical protein
MPSKTKIILLLLFWFCAGARPRPSAHEAPGPRGRRTRRAPVRQCVDAPNARIHARSARAAVRGPGGVQFVLAEQGRRSSGPCGTRCPALTFRTFFAHWGLGCAASFFFLVPKPSNSCNQFFKSHENVDRDSLVLTSRPRQIWEGEAIRSSRCSATAPC